MAYACPVCGTPEADGEHLANHLAVTAMLHADDHEEWLDEHVPGWSGRSPGALAADVVGFAEETDHEPAVEGAGGGHEHVRRGPGPVPTADLDAEARRILEEARELTRERTGEDGEEGAE